MKSRTKKGIKRVIPGLRKVRRSLPGDVVKLVREERDRGVQARAADDASKIADERRVESFEIGSEMKKAGLSNSFIVATVTTADEFEGIFNLMMMWRAESEKGERDAIIADIQELNATIAEATGASRERAAGSLPLPRVDLELMKAPLDPKMRAKALGAFLDDWERVHGPITAVELSAAKTSMAGEQPWEIKKGAKRKYRTAADVLADVPRLGAFARKLRVVDQSEQAGRRADTAPSSFSDHMFQDLVSVAMHGVITQKILKDPSLIEQARNTLERWISKQRPAPQPFIEWRQILAGTPQQIAAIAIGLTEEATRLRSSSPLGCLLQKNERAAVRALFSKKGQGR